MLRSTGSVNPPDSANRSNQTLRALFECEESNLLRYAYSLTGRRAVAEEIVQETFLQLHSRWDEVVSPHAWLYRSVRNRALNHLRKTKREVLRSEDVIEQAEADNEQSPEKLVDRMAVAAAIRSQLQHLGESDRQLIQLKYFEGLSYREMSERTGLSISNVGYRLHHILKRLAVSLQSLGPDDES